MKFIADLHIHSRFARATSKDMTLENLDRWAKIKGIKVMGTGDFTHPLWFKELQEQLEPAEQGLYKLKPAFAKAASFAEVASATKAESAGEARFLFTSEISCIYSKGGEVRRVHLILIAPSIAAVEKINTRLGWIGNLKSDGRPILGIDAKEVLKIALDADPDCMIVPAHIYTPWFSVFGSKSGFNSLDECFDEYTKYIYACETGLSSDPEMSWRNSALDKIALISNSDSHSLEKIGREANVFDTELSYSALMQAIKTKDPSKFLYTVEFFPEEGKYHFDGHRLCGVSMAPAESKKNNNMCPKCKKPLVIGVLNRVEELADRPAFDESSADAKALADRSAGKPEGAIPFKKMIPLQEIIADALGVNVGTKQGKAEYEKLVQEFGNEFAVLLDADNEALRQATLPEIAEGVKRVREGKVSIDPGYDGEYGKIKIFGEHETRSPLPQKTLF